MCVNKKVFGYLDDGKSTLRENTQDRIIEWVKNGFFDKMAFEETQSAL